MEYNPEELNKILKEAQAKHLRAIEEWAASQPKLNGVPIVQALTYDAIQIANQAFLKTLLGEQDG